MGNEWFRQLSCVQRIIQAIEVDDSRVCVTLLDTGVSRGYPDIAEFIRNGSIAQYQGFPDNLDPLHDKDGHGIHGVSVLLKTAPHATLLVAWVADDNREIPAIDNYSAVETVNVNSVFRTDVRQYNGH